MDKRFRQRLANDFERGPGNFAAEFVQFGTIWGNSQASANALAHDRDWFYDAATQNLSVYSSGGNPVIAFAGVAPIILSGQSLINHQQRQLHRDSTYPTGLV